jgi:hypothetical protein
MEAIRTAQSTRSHHNGYKIPSDHIGGLYGAIMYAIMTAPRNQITENDFCRFETFAFMKTSLKRAVSFIIKPNDST